MCHMIAAMKEAYLAMYSPRLFKPRVKLCFFSLIPVVIKTTDPYILFYFCQFGGKQVTSFVTQGCFHSVRGGFSLTNVVMMLIH